MTHFGGGGGGGKMGGIRGGGGGMIIFMGYIDSTRAIVCASDRTVLNCGAQEQACRIIMNPRAALNPPYLYLYLTYHTLCQPCYLQLRSQRFHPQSKLQS